LAGLVAGAIQRRGGFSHDTYYQLLALADKLSPSAQAVAQEARLTEGQLRETARKLAHDPTRQLACVQAIAAHGLPKRDADALVAAVLAGADPAEAAARLAGAPEGQPASAAKPASPRPAQPQPPQVLRRAGRGMWRDLQRAQRALSWAQDYDVRQQRVAQLRSEEREALQEQAAVIREIGEALADLLQ
jgi:hypothetical protein